LAAKSTNGKLIKLTDYMIEGKKIIILFGIR
jgi:hypothetical protein